MARTRVRRVDYPKQDFAQAVSEPIKRGAEDLFEGVLQVFPKVDAGRLKNWLEERERREVLERGQLLFIALVCGTAFGVYPPRVNERLRDLWQWLTWRPRDMDPELAELLVAALAPALAREIRAREGWRLGLSAGQGKRPGAPPTSRAAWVVALMSEYYLRRRGAKPADATGGAIELAAILTTRELAAPEELRREQRRLGTRKATDLSEALDRLYEWWLKHDAVRSEDPEPGSDEPDTGRAAWRARHGGLSKVLSIYGTQSLAEQAIRTIWPNGASAHPKTARPLPVSKRSVQAAREVNTTAKVSRSQRGVRK